MLDSTCTSPKTLQDRKQSLSIVIQCRSLDTRCHPLAQHRKQTRNKREQSTPRNAKHHVRYPAPITLAAAICILYQSSKIQSCSTLITAAPLCIYSLASAYPFVVGMVDHRRIAPKNEHPTTMKPMIIGVLPRG
jgi:hypothetical protein